MESETKPNKAHHENGQNESLDLVKITPTNVDPGTLLEDVDYGSKVSITQS